MMVNLFPKKPPILEKKRLSFEGYSLIEKHKSLDLKTLDLEAKQNSVKNFVLVDNDDNDYEYLKMTKTSQNMF